MASRALKNRPGTRNRRRYIPVLYILVVFAALIIAGCCATYALASSWLQDLPDYQDASSYNLAQKTRVYASDGTTLLAEFYLENREPVSDLSDISPYVTQGTVATEDERFYQHHGIDPIGIARAVVNNLTGGSTEGASTLTQQFVRNTVLSDEMSEQTLKRKVREAYIALKLEESYSKDDILLMYLNTVNYGSGAYGIEAAAKKYFSVDAGDLTLAQAALLVGIPQSPTYNNPINYPDNAIARRNTVLARMLSNSVITQDQYDEAVNEPLNLKVTETTESGIYQYPYFTSYVRQVLLDQYSEAEVFKGGLTVTTTLDVKAQRAAEKAAAREDKEVDSDVEAALVAVEPSTGYIRALVGGRDYNANEYNLATQAQRQAGSSFKTFTLAAAIENGIDPNKTYVDCNSPATIDMGENAQPWTVENYSGHNYGTLSLADAFAVSSNTGFARLVTAIGSDKVVDIAHRMGIESDLQSVPSITLGTQGVTVREMAGAYATIATGGIQHDAVAIEKITDANGKTIFQADTTGTRVITEETAHALEKVMEGVVTNGTGKAAALDSGQTVAGKTGTSQNWRDKWFVGITPQYSVACWEGAREERQMSSSYDVSDMFADFLNQLISSSDTEAFPMDSASDPTWRTLSSDEQDTLGATSYSGYASSSYSSLSSSDSDSSSSSSSSKSSKSSRSSRSSSSDSSSSSSSSDDESSSSSKSSSSSGKNGSGSSSGASGAGESSSSGGESSSGSESASSGGSEEPPSNPYAR